MRSYTSPQIEDLRSYRYEIYTLDQLLQMDIGWMCQFIEQLAEDVDSYSIQYMESSAYSRLTDEEKEIANTALGKDYSSCIVIENILKNVARIKSGIVKPETIKQSLIFVALADENEPVAGIQAVVTSEKAELMWIGSLIPGLGRQLLVKVAQIVKQHGHTVMKGRAKHGSEKYYRRIPGSKVTPDQGESRFGGMMGLSSADIELPTDMKESVLRSLLNT